jgi:hypothetical protein
MKISDFALAPVADLQRLERLEAENAKLRALVEEVVSEGRADPTIGWFRRARAALAEEAK